MPFINIQSSYRQGEAPVIPTIEEDDYVLTSSYYSALSAADSEADVYVGDTGSIFLSSDGTTLFVLVTSTALTSNVIEVYRDQGGTWVLEDTLEPPTPSTTFGYPAGLRLNSSYAGFSSSADGNYLVVSELLNDTGVLIYHYDGVSWALQQTVYSDPSIPEALYVPNVFEFTTLPNAARATGISADGSRMFIVNLYDVETPHPYGEQSYTRPFTGGPEYKRVPAAFVLTFDRVGSTWSFSGVIRGMVDDSRGMTSYAVTISGDGQVIAIESSPYYINYDEWYQYFFPPKHRISIYEWGVGDTWELRDQVNPFATGTPNANMQLSYDGSTLVHFSDTGVPGTATNGLGELGNNDGVGTVFERNGNNWMWSANITSNDYQESPTTVSLSADGTTLVVGRPYGYVSFSVPGGGRGDNSTFDNNKPGRIDIYKKQTGSTDWDFYRSISHPMNYQKESTFGWATAISGDGRRIVVVDRNAPVSTEVAWAPGSKLPTSLLCVYDLLTVQEPLLPHLELTHTNRDVASVENDGFGTAVNISADGNTMVVTKATGDTLKVYTKQGNDWILQQTLTSPIPLTISIDGQPQISSDGNTIVAMAMVGIELRIIAFRRILGVWGAGVHIDAIDEFNFRLVYDLSGDGTRLAVAGNEGESAPVVVVYRRTDDTTWNRVFVFRPTIAPLPQFFTAELEAVTALSFTENGNTLLMSGCDFLGDIVYAVVLQDTSVGTDGSDWGMQHFLNNPLYSSYTNKQFGSLSKISSDGSTIAVVDNNTFEDNFYPEWRGSNCVVVFKRDKDGRFIVNDLLYPDVSTGTARINSIDLSSDGSTLFISTDSNGNLAVKGGNIHTWSYESISPGSPIKKWFKGVRTTVESPLANINDAFAKHIACSGDGGVLVASGGSLEDMTGDIPVDNSGAVLVYNKTARSSTIGSRKWKILQTLQPPIINESSTETLWGAHLSATKDGKQCAAVTSRYDGDGNCFILHLLKNDLLQSFPLNDQLEPAGKYGISISDDSENYTLAFTGMNGNTFVSELFILNSTTYQVPLLSERIVPAANTEFRHVAVSGDSNTVFVSVYDTVASAYTSVQMYTRTLGVWSLQQTITPDPITYAVGGGFGTSMSSSYDGRTVVIGAANASPTNSSLVFIYKWNGSAMVEVFNSETPNPGPPPASSSMYGTSVSINSAGTRMVVGDPERFEAYVYDTDGVNWNLTTTLVPYADYQGIDLLPNRIGYSVAISGDGNYIVVGGPDAVGGGGAINGLVAVYRLVSSTWRLEDMLFNDMLDPHQTGFGTGVAINQDGSLIYVGAPTQDIGVNWWNSGSNGLIYVWANKFILGQKAGLVQKAWPFPRVRPYVTKRLANVDEEFQIKIDVDNPTDVTLTNVQITFLTVNDSIRWDLDQTNNLYDVVDTLSIGSVAGTLNPSKFVWTIPTLAPGATCNLTRAAKQANTAYGQNLTVMIQDVTSDQAIKEPWWPTYGALPHANVVNANTSTGSILAPNTIAFMSKAYFYTICQSQNLGAGMGMQNAWTNDFENLLIEYPGQSIAPYHFSFYNSAGAPNDGYNVYDWPWGDPRTYPMHVAVAPNGKFVFISNYFDDLGRAFSRDLVGTLKPTPDFLTPFPNPSDVPGMDTIVNIAISPDAAAKYMVICENTPTNGFKLFRKSPTALTWERMAAPTGYVDTDIPTYASWSEDGTYLALSTLGGTRPFYVWKLDWNTETWTDLSFVTALNGLSRGSVVKFSRDVNNKILLFVAPAWETDNFNASAGPANAPAVDNTNDTISLSVKYPTGSQVVYNRLSRPNTITGFTDGGTYYIRQVSTGSTWAWTYSFYNTYNDAVNNTNKINLTATTGGASGFHRMTPVGTGKTSMYVLDKSDDSIVEIPFVVCLRENQTEANYNGVGSNGTFAPGLGYVAGTVITLQEGTRVTINTVGGSGQVLTFAIEDRDESKRGHRAGVTLPAINGAGTGFSLTPGTNNEQEHGRGSSFVSATWSDNYLVIIRSTISRPPRSIDDSAYLEIFHRSGTDGEVFDHFTGTISDGYPVASTYRGKWNNAAITSGQASITSVSANFISRGVTVGDRVYLKSGNYIGTYTVSGVSNASTILVQGIGGNGAFIAPTENNENEIRWNGSWPGSATGLTMSIVSQGTAWGEPRSVSFNHDGTILAIGGKSNIDDYYPTVLYRFPTSPNRVYKVEGTTFTRLTTGRPEERGPGLPNTDWILNTSYNQSWWMAYPNNIDVWPGVFSGPYYNATDWS